MLVPQISKWSCGLICLAQIATAAVSPHPNVTWTAEATQPERTQIQIATDADFSEVVDRDVIEQVARYVPDQALAAGEYYWKVRNAAGVDARDLKDGHIGDFMHYNTASQEVIGARFAKAFEAMNLNK